MTDERGRMAQALFDFLAQSGVPYCVVGDTRGYPREISSDIDIVVPNEAFPGVPQFVARFCREQDARIVQLIRHEQTAVYFVLAWVSGNGELCFLAPDICSDYRRGGRLLLCADEILAQRQPAVDERGGNGGFFVPPPALQFIYYLLKRVDKNELGDRHGDCLSTLWTADPSCAWNEICRFWPRPEDADLIARAAAGNDWAPVHRALPQLRRALHRSAPRSLRDLAGEGLRRLERVLRPTGLSVAVLGPDGCGKSSVIDRLLTELTPVFRRTGCFHLRPRLFSDGSTAALPVTRPHAQPARGAVASVAKLAYFMVDYAFGWLVRVWPSAIRSTLVVFDRYYHDLLVDPRRFRYGGPARVARWAAYCVPAPDMWVLLDAPAEILQRRKSEVSIGESERQRRAYLRLMNRRWNAAVVDASRGIAQVVAETEDFVLRFLQQRIESRYPQLRLKENPASARVLLYFCRHDVPALSKLLRIVFNSDIYCRIRFPIIMPHPYGVTIHSKTVIGSGVTVMQQVTIGSKDPDENVAPTIEDDVYIGAGAKVLGGIRVGRGAVIGANAVVTRDVPPYCTVVGANRVVRGGPPSGLGQYAQRGVHGHGARHEPMSA